MLTPAIREYYKKYGVKVDVAIVERFRTSRIFQNNPYVNEVHYLDNSWYYNINANIHTPISNQNNLISTYPKELPQHKIFINAGLLGLKIMLKLQMN